MAAFQAYRRVFANPALARLLIGEFISAIGDWLYLVALLVVVFQRSESAALVGVVGAVRVVPYIVLSVPAGIIVDRFDRRLILIVTDLARGAIMVVLAILVLVEGPLLAIVALSFLATCFSTFFRPAIGAFLPSLVRDESELGPANSASASLDNLGWVIGPALAGILIAIGGLTLAFIINAVTFAVIATILWRLPSAAGPPVARRSTPADAPGISVGDALRTVMRPVVGLTLVNAVGGFALGGVTVLTVVIAVDVLQQGQVATGYLNAAIGVGGLLGAAGSAALVVGRRLLVPLIAGALLFGLGLIVLGLGGGLVVALVAMTVASAGSLIVDVVSTTLFQRAVPDAVRGRALGVMNTVAVAAFAAGSLLVPIAAGTLGVLPALLGSAAVVLVGTLAGSLILGGQIDRLAGLDPPRATLHRVAQFAGLPIERVEEAGGRADVRSTTTGEVIIRQGDEPDRFYVVVSGDFLVTQQAGNEPAAELRHLGPGEAFGEIGLLSGVPRTATVTSVTDGTLLALDERTFLDLVSAAPGLSSRMLEVYRPTVAT